MGALGFVRVGDEPAQEVLRGPGQLRDAPRHQAARAALRDRESSPGRRHCRRDALDDVPALGEVAVRPQDRLHQRLHAVEPAGCPGIVRGRPRAQPHVDSGQPGQEGDGHRAQVLGDAPVYALGERGFGDSGGVEDAVDQRQQTVPQPLAEQWLHALVEQPAHLRGDAGEEHDDPAFHVQRQPGRGPDPVGKNQGALGHPGHALVSGRKRGPAPGRPSGPELVEQPLVQTEGPVQRLGHDLPRDVVPGGTQAPRHQHDVGNLQRARKRAPDVRRTVPDHEPRPHRKPQAPGPPPHPGAIGVDGEAGQKFVTHRDDGATGRRRRGPAQRLLPARPRLRQK